MKRNGWTLIEVLTGVAIILVFAALILSALFVARTESQQIVCLSNIRQIGQATLLYAQDYDETFPIGFSPKSNRSGIECVLTVWNLTSPYFKSHDILLCSASPYPTNLFLLEQFRPVGIRPCEPQPRWTTTQPNWCLFVNLLTYPQSPAVELAHLPFPSLTGMWFDGWFGSSDGARFEPYSGAEAWHQTSRHIPPIVPIREAGKYRGELNAVYVDGHARFHFAVVAPDQYNRGNFIEIIARPTAIDGRQPPRWRIQNGAYHNKESFYGWISREHPYYRGRYIYRCYPRGYWNCDEWE